MLLAEDYLREMPTIVKNVVTMTNIMEEGRANDSSVLTPQSAIHRDLEHLQSISQMLLNEAATTKQIVRRLSRTRC